MDVGNVDHIFLEQAGVDMLCGRFQQSQREPARERGYIDLISPSLGSALCTSKDLVPKLGTRITMI